VNIDDEYHEEQSSAKEASVEPAPGTA
jgi:hypothetical protein